MLRLELSEAAKADLDELRDYLLPLSSRGHANVVAAIKSRINTVLAHPGSGRPTDHRDIREAIEPRYGFKIPYLVRGESLFVLRIYNARRTPLTYEDVPSPE